MCVIYENFESTKQQKFIILICLERVDFVHRGYLFLSAAIFFLPRARILFRFRGESVELCLLISFLFFFWGFFPFVIFLFLTVHCCFAALPLFRNRQYFSVHNRCWCYILKGVSCGNNAFFRLGGAFGGGVLHRLALLQSGKKKRSYESILHQSHLCRQMQKNAITAITEFLWVN